LGQSNPVAAAPGIEKCPLGTPLTERSPKTAKKRSAVTAGGEISRERKCLGSLTVGRPSAGKVLRDRKYDTYAGILLIADETKGKKEAKRMTVQLFVRNREPQEGKEEGGEAQKSPSRLIGVGERKGDGGSKQRVSTCWDPPEKRAFAYRAGTRLMGKGRLGRRREKVCVNTLIGSNRSSKGLLNNARGCGRGAC